MRRPPLSLVGTWMFVGGIASSVFLGTVSIELGMDLYGSALLILGLLVVGVVGGLIGLFGVITESASPAVKRVAAAVVLLAVLGVVLWGGRNTEPQLPVGTWAIEDPEAAVRGITPRVRARLKGNRAVDTTDEGIRKTYLAGFRDMVFDFREDGTVHQLSPIRPWDSGRWSRDGAAVTVKVKRYGDTNLAVDIPFRIDGDFLTWNLPGCPVRLRRWSRSAAGGSADTKAPPYVSERAVDPVGSLPEELTDLLMATFNDVRFAEFDSALARVDQMQEQGAAEAACEMLRAEVRAAMDQPENALAHLARAIEIEPAYLEAVNMRKGLLRKRWSFDK